MAGAHTPHSLIGTLRLAQWGRKWMAQTVIPWFFGGEWLTVGEGITKSRTPTGLELAVDSAEMAAKLAGDVAGFGGVPIIAKITGSGAAAGLYEATEQVFDDSADVWINKSGGYSFVAASAGEVREINGQIGLKIGSFVQVFPVTGDDGVVNWMCEQRLEFFVGKITANGGSGSYTVRRLKIDGTAYTPTTDVTATELNGQADIVVNSVVFVLGDGSTYRIWTGSFYDDGTTQDNSYTGEHTDAVRTGVDFTRGTNAKKYKFTVSVGDVYRHDGDQIWYQNRQDFILATNGTWQAVGDEYQTEIDAPEQDCS